MKLYLLTEQEKSGGPYTHKVVISKADGDFTAAGLTQTYTLLTAPVGTVVTNAAVRAVTFLSGGSVSAATIVVGKTGTTNAYVASYSVFTGGTAIKAGDGASFNQAGGDGLSTAIDLVCVLTTVTDNIVNLTAGEIHIFLRLTDITKL